MSFTTSSFFSLGGTLGVVRINKTDCTYTYQSFLIGVSPYVDQLTELMKFIANTTSSDYVLAGASYDNIASSHMEMVNDTFNVLGIVNISGIADFALFTFIARPLSPDDTEFIMDTYNYEIEQAAVITPFIRSK